MATTHPNMFFFWVISKVFVVNFEHVFVCWKRYSTKTIVILILKYLAEQAYNYCKSAT